MCVLRRIIFAFSKVMEAEKAKTDSEAEHLQRAAFYTAAEQACQRLEKRLKKHVVKAQPYFEQKEAFNKALEAQKEQVQSLQLKVNSSIFAKSKILHCKFMMVWLMVQLTCMVFSHLLLPTLESSVVYGR